MSQENVELIESLLQRVDIFEVVLSAADVREAAAAAGLGPDVFADDAEVRFVSRTGGLGPTEGRGPAGLREGFLDWLSPWKSYQGETEALIDAGDEVVELVRIRATTARGGVESEHRAGTVYRIRDSRIVGMTFYLDWDQALEAVGLEE